MIALVLSKEEIDLLQWHRSEISKAQPELKELGKYYRGQQIVEHMGFSLPKEVRDRFTVVANWARVPVDAKDDRMEIRSLLLPGDEEEDPRLKEIVEDGLGEQVSFANKDRLIFSRGHLTAATPAKGQPARIRAVSPRQMNVDIDALTGLEKSAGRVFTSPGRPGKETQTAGSLYLPDTTVHAVLDGGKWVEVRRDNHKLGQVPVVTIFNRRLSDEWVGESEMAALTPLVDAVARTLTSLGAVMEFHGAPRLWIAGMAEEELKDKKTGRVKGKFQAYINALTILKDPGAKMGQISAAEVKNFDEAIRTYANQAIATTGLPARYWGITSANPESVDAIIAGETDFIRDVESDCTQMGTPFVGRAAQLVWQLRTGEKLERPVTVEWYNPATPTLAQRTDALVKLLQVGGISYETIWEELGWSPAKIETEKKRLADERAAMNPVDPDIHAITDAFRSTSGPTFDTSQWQ